MDEPKTFHPTPELEQVKAAAWAEAVREGWDPAIHVENTLVDHFTAQSLEEPLNPCTALGLLFRVRSDIERLVEYVEGAGFGPPEHSVNLVEMRAPTIKAWMRTQLSGILWQWPAANDFTSWSIH